MLFQALFIPFIALVTGGLFVWWYALPTQAVAVIAAAAAIFAFTAWRLNRGRGEWWNFVILPLLLCIGSIGYAMIISSPLVISLLGLITVIGQTLYWRYVLLYAIRPSAYQPFSLERLSLSLNFLAFYFIVSAIFGFTTFLNLSFALPAALFMAALILLMYQWMWISKIGSASGWRYGGVITVIMAQLFIILGFLPLHFHVLGFLAATAYYACLFMISEKTAHALTKFKRRLTLGVLAGSWFVVLVTARWF